MGKSFADVMVSDLMQNSGAALPGIEAVEMNYANPLMLGC